MPDPIEVEVIEVDGETPPQPPSPRGSAARQTGFGWQGIFTRFARLDRRWWPLWVLLGAIGAVIFLTVGLVVIVGVVVLRAIRGLLHLFHPAPSAR